MHSTFCLTSSPEIQGTHNLSPELTETTEKVCAHGTCNCPATPGSDYCSPYCEGSGETTNVTLDESQEIICDCGHPTCVG